MPLARTSQHSPGHLLDLSGLARPYSPSMTTLGAAIVEAGRALGDARGMYGATPVSGEWQSTGGLVRAGGAVARTHRQAQESWQGVGGGTYRSSAGRGWRALDVVTGADEGAQPGLAGGATVGRQGRGGMDGVIASTQSGVGALAPTASTPAGQRALITHLQGQLGRAKALLQLSQQQDRQLAGLVRAAAAGYGGQAPPAAPMSFSPSGMGGGGGAGLSAAPFGAATGSFAGTRGRRQRRGREAGSPLHLSAHGPGPERVRAAIRQALDLKGIRDPAARARWESGMMLVAQRESNFSSTAKNLSDDNAVRGDPSVGTWQFIDATFRAYHEPGTAMSRTDDVAGACAFINYAQRHYHVSLDGSNLAANIQQADPTRSPRGY